MRCRARAPRARCAIPRADSSARHGKTLITYHSFFTCPTDMTPTTTTSQRSWSVAADRRSGAASTIERAPGFEPEPVGRYRKPGPVHPGDAREITERAVVDGFAAGIPQSTREDQPLEVLGDELTGMDRELIRVPRGRDRGRDKGRDPRPALEERRAPAHRQPVDHDDDQREQAEHALHQHAQPVNTTDAHPARALVLLASPEITVEREQKEEGRERRPSSRAGCTSGSTVS